MIQLPLFLKSFRRSAIECLAQGCAKEIEFSRGTYQILILDPPSKKEEWVFFQFDEQCRLKDSFCTCPASENNHGCIHQAIAFIHVYGGYNQPLHVRFEKSIWNKLCRQCAQDSEKKLQETEPGHYVVSDDKGNEFFSIQATTDDLKAKLHKIFFEKQEETEETSIKFSNRSQDDLAAWREGKCPPELSYELSCWYDLAKWLLSQQENKTPYEVSFKYHGSKSKSPPIAISIVFAGLSINKAFTQNQLTLIIPALKTINSPLKVHYVSKSDISEITYDKSQQKFLVKQLKLPGKISGLTIGDWIYVENDGFYSKAAQSLPPAEELGNVEKALNEHIDILKSLLTGCSIYESPTPISYELKFDASHSLHIDGYILFPGDLQEKESHLFDSWAYINGHGFYHIEGSYFDQISMIIPSSKIADFISQNRTWLNAQPHFSTHTTSMQSDLGYELKEDNSLIFIHRSDIKDKKLQSIDFGHWIYLPNEGFFAKTGSQIQMSVSTDIVIPADQIPIFIQRNFNELQLIDGFFSERCPVIKTQLTIDLTSTHQIQVTPIYELSQDYQGKEVLFFDHFTYVKGEGFHSLNDQIRLPERYSSLVKIPENDVDSFITNDLPNLLPFTSFIDPRLRQTTKKNLVVKNIDTLDNSEKHEYALQLSYQSELGTISLASLWTALQKSQHYLLSDAGLIDLSDKQFGWIKNLSKGNINRRDKTVLLSSLELLRLNAFDKLTIPTETTSSGKYSLERLHDLLDFRVPEEPNITGLLSQLRPYQYAGLEWLWFLYNYGLSGLLCDDMGLGKTHQAMALLMSTKNSWKKKQSTEKHHSIIICPTSVIYHWQEKLKKFLPEMNVWTFHGMNRSLENFHEESDILLTSYGVWRNEAKALKGMKFDIAIFDEIQIAKNQASQVYHSLLKINARMKLGMTGTPIENRLRELKTLFDLVLPSYMLSESEYKKTFVSPIEKHGNVERKQLLSRLINPFVLRRKKEDVLFDLPEKTEEVSYCDLLPQQVQLYTQVLSSSRDRILNDLRSNSSPIPYIHIFALLAHLKQICNHPAVYLKEPEEYKNYQSGKWNLFVELLEEARESGQKVVVFSQYLTMLDIIESYLKEHNIGYATIRGSTVNRGEQVERFNTNPKCEVFVASLQAAGLGIDLTAASVVIHYDRWWNAAREKQATDRVHRIGQTRGVQVFKLTTKATIEEHIDLMISKKGQLLEDIIGVDNHQIIKKLDRDEIIELLQITPR